MLVFSYEPRRILRVEVSVRFVLRFLGSALAAVLAAVVTSFVVFVMLLPALVRQGPSGPVEPHWLGSVILLPTIALASAVAGRSLARDGSARLASSVALGSLIGSLLNLVWLGQQLTQGVGRPQPISGEHLLVLLLAALATVLGFCSVSRWAQRGTKCT